MNNVSQSAIYEHLKEMLKIAEDAERKGILEDDGKTVTSIRETMERIEQGTNYSQIIAGIGCCSKFPCNIIESSLLHTNVMTRSNFYERGIRLCTSYYHLRDNLLCGGVEDGEAISMLTYFEREELDRLFGL